ncbi:hypothetical protein [Streptomyces griseosporeus]|uniref:hypothetical protein n=1 Tax=Streptomyces griseosporeus TaxID=1910 RepID=UPI00167D196D|nr:hypothetical protein [Streptomyces griseosporeus]GHF50713.1 hypothetical protein GCM10018783_19150 [Streptomyces griseosporeus]
MPARRAAASAVQAWTQRRARWIQWPGLTTRYDKTATIYLAGAGLHIAAIFIWSAR